MEIEAGGIQVIQEIIVLFLFVFLACLIVLPAVFSRIESPARLFYGPAGRRTNRTVITIYISLLLAGILVLVMMVCFYNR